MRDADDLDIALRDLEASGAFADEVLVQDLIAGTTEKAQSVFCRGRMIGFHAYRQVAAGVGGGEAIKQSVSRPVVRAHVEKIGRQLDWHGALSVDYIVPDDDASPLLIDCNPRLVEPMNAHRSGVDLVGLLLLISLGELPAALPEGRRACSPIWRCRRCSDAGRVTARGATSSGNAGVCCSSGPYAGSTEELTPVNWTG